MNPDGPSRFQMTEQYWQGILLALAAAVLLVSVWCLTNGITTVFMHLYYFPIVLLAYHYRWKGCGLAALLALFYLGLVVLFDAGQPDVIYTALLRFVVFVGIAAVIAYLSDLLAREKEVTTDLQQFQESVIANANIWITVLAPDGTILVWNDAAEAISGYTRSEVVGRKRIWKQIYPEKEYRRNITSEIIRIIGKDTYLENFETTIRCADGSTKTIVWNTRSLRDNTGAVTGYIAIGRDVSAQKSAEQQLRESEEKYRTVIEKANESVIIAQDGLFVFANASMSRLLGVPVEELMGKPFAGYIWPDDRDLVVTRHRERIAGGDIPESYDFRIIGAGGRMRWVSITAAQIPWDGRLATLSLLTDITERKHVEEALQESESFNRGLVENLPDYLAVYGHDGNLLYVNPASARALGYDVETLIGTPVLSYVAEEFREAVLTKMTVRLKEGDLSPYEIEMITKGGERRSVIVKAAPIQFRNNPAILLLLIDITERKKGEEALRQSEEKFRLIVENSHDIIYMLSTDGRFIFVSPSWTTLLGHPVSDVMGQSIQKFIHPEDIGRCMTAMQNVMENGLQQTGIEYRVQHIDGTWRWHTSSAVPIRDEAGKITGGEGTARDITERKRAEEEIRLSNVILKTQQETSPDGILIVGKTGNVLSYNSRFAEIWNIPYEILDTGSDELLLSSVIDRVSDQEQFLARIRSIYDNPVEKSQEEIKLRDGRVIERYSAPMLGEDNQYFGRVWYFHDITERKHAEEEIRSREEQFRVIFHNQHTGLLMIDAVTHTIADVNTAALSMIGASRESVLGKLCHTFVCPAEAGKCPVSNLGQNVDNSERILIRANGEKMPILKSVNTVTISAHQYLIESFIDLSERKQMESRIRESRQLFMDIISFLPDPTLVIDKEGIVIAWNRAMEDLSGVLAADIIGKGDHEYSIWLYGKRRPILIDLVLHPDQDSARLNYIGISGTGRSITAQTEITLPGDGRKTTLSLVASPLFDEQGKTTGAIESMRDITRLKEAEDELAKINRNLEQIVRERTNALAESEKKYRTLFDKTKDAFLIIENNKFVDCNSAALQMLHYNTKEELLQIHPSQLSPPTQPDGRSSFEKAEEMMAMALREGSHRFEWVHRRSDGEDFWVEVSLTAIPIHDHPVIHTSWRDITDRKKAEAEIQASLDEKVLLLREIHHRVKNNLQIIISLTNLQMRQTDDPVVKQIMSETQNRVRAMSLVHEKLYRSASLSRIDFADYVRYLATQLFSFYGMDTRRVRMEFTMKEIMVDINTAVPLGLLMNELVSNALKHAFPQGREGVLILGGEETDGIITLVVSDNGTGMPADLDWKNTPTLGMRLMNSLIDQVDGEVILDRNRGTTFTIKIRRKPPAGGGE